MSHFRNPSNNCKPPAFERDHTQASFSATSSVEAADEEVEAVLSRIRVMAPERAKMREDHRRYTDIESKLLAGGYPYRHVEKLEAMYGPGLDKAVALTPEVIKGDFSVVLHGERGPGKTQIATYLAAERLKAGKGAGVYVKAADIITQIKSTWSNDRNAGTEAEIMRRYRGASLLVIDEYQEITKQLGDWVPEKFVTLFDHRYDARRVTIIIANGDRAAVEGYLNPSIKSRIEETGGFAHCDWPSYRAAGEREA